MIDHEEIVINCPKARAHYDLCISNGCGPRLAEVLALRAFPAIRTDATFNRGRCNGNQFEDTPGLGNTYKAVADEAGVSVTGKTYLSGLAEYPGDPEAWVSDRGDVLRVAKKKGMKVSGDVNYVPPEREPSPDVPIASDILRREVDAYLELDPGARVEDVEERVFNALTGRVDLNPTLLVED